MLRRIVVALGVLVLGSQVWSQEGDPEEFFSIADKLSPSFVVVEYTFQYDKSEEPPYPGPMRLREERPEEMAGFLLTPTKVLTLAPHIHPRFIKDISVRFGEQVVGAKVAAVARNYPAVFLEIGKPFDGAKPLEFDPNAQPPYSIVEPRNVWDKMEGEWAIKVISASPTYIVRQNKERLMEMRKGALVVGKDGIPVGFHTATLADDSWKGSPLEWSAISGEEWKVLQIGLEKRCREGLLHVTMNFRSPRKEAGQRWRRWDTESQPTEMDVIGLLLDEKTILLPLDLDPETTALLERFTVHLPNGETVGAKFSLSLDGYAALLITPEKPLNGAIKLSIADIHKYQDTLLLFADVRLMGETRISHFHYGHIMAMRTGWKRHVYPYPGGAWENLFVFDEGGALVAFPLVRRHDPFEENSSWGRHSWRGYDGDESRLMAVFYLADIIREPEKHADVDNIPLDESREGRLAWLGVELQPINEELARASGVSDLTENGESGAMVSYVYPDSPASRAEIIQGDILLQLHVSKRPAPVIIRLDTSAMEGEAFPWDDLDEIPEQYFDQIPSPWPSVKNGFNLMLSRIGFGNGFTIDVFRGGKIIAKELEVIESPAHFGTAPKYKSVEMGLTVRDMTYEARRYLQKKADAPGVIVAKLEQGGKSSVAGIRPYEGITHVNDEPVNTVEDFERLVAGQTELRLGIERMHKRRIVRLALPASPGTLNEMPGGPPISQE